jgi:hypothetical protein
MLVSSGSLWQTLTPWNCKTQYPALLEILSSALHSGPWIARGFQNSLCVQILSGTDPGKQLHMYMSSGHRDLGQVHPGTWYPACMMYLRTYGATDLILKKYHNGVLVILSCDGQWLYDTSKVRKSSDSMTGESPWSENGLIQLSPKAHTPQGLRHNPGPGSTGTTRHSPECYLQQPETHKMALPWHTVNKSCWWPHLTQSNPQTQDSTPQLLDMTAAMPNLSNEKIQEIVRTNHRAQRRFCDEEQQLCTDQQSVPI